ncbi:hypothetical protein QTV49_000449 [Vibrio vulnificus]|nr:hypothetical protein [Vibrio vulnificus]
MSNITLNLTFALTELMRLGVNHDEAAKILNESNFYMEKVFDSLDVKSFSDSQSAILRTMLTRFFISSKEFRTEEFSSKIVDSLKVNDVLIGHNKIFPREVALTLCVRAINKYKDFVFLLMLTETLSYENYNALVKAGDEEIKKAISSSLKIFEKIAGGTISEILFASILEDAINTSITPVLESISKDSKLRQHFIIEPRQLLVPISAHVAEKVKNAIYFSDALIKVATK